MTFLCVEALEIIWVTRILNPIQVLEALLPPPPTAIILCLEIVSFGYHQQETDIQSGAFLATLATTLMEML